jgi:hypothetical protein
MAQVPRIKEITGKQSREDAAAEREWSAARKRYQDDKAKHGFGTDTGKAAWKRRTQNTRSA